MPANRAVADWTATAQAQLLRGDAATALATLVPALAQYPTSIELRRLQAGAYAKLGQDDKAEAVLQELLAMDPHDAGAAFTLAHLLQGQGRTAAAAACLRTCLDAPFHRGDADLAIRAIELTDDCDRKLDAAAIADAAIAANPVDARLHAYAGMLAIQLGRFDAARDHYLFALAHDARAWEWHVPLGLSATQRYTDATHPDFTRFREGLQRTDLSEPARMELQFALGKACDDTLQYAQAATHFRAGNATAGRLARWSRKAWRRGIEARLAARPIPCSLRMPDDFTPILIVGMPRCGTTLLAQLLARHPFTRNGGELPWLARLADQPELAGDPGRAALEAAARTYATQARRDDTGDAHWFIDKQPLNFRYLDLLFALFPDARVIHCQRGARDTALSLWMQCFREDVQGYSCDFADIALTMRDCDRLMAHWRSRHGEAIRTLRYEDMVASPRDVVADLARWIGLPPAAHDTPPAHTSPSSINTASLWQARQPIHTHSVGRWRHYIESVPELLRFPE